MPNGTQSLGSCWAYAKLCLSQIQDRHLRSGTKARHRDAVLLFESMKTPGDQAESMYVPFVAASGVHILAKSLSREVEAERDTVLDKCSIIACLSSRIVDSNH